VLTLTAAVLAVLTYGLMSPMLGVLLPTYALNSAQLGNLGLTNALGLVIASVSAGPLVDLYGKRLALVSGLSLAGAALFWLPTLGSYSALLTAYFTLGVGGGVISTASNSLVGDISPERRGPALNFLNLFFGLGGILTTYAASYVFRPMPLCYSVATVAVIALAVNLTVPMARGTGGFGFDWEKIPRLLSSPILMLLSLLMFLYVACEVGVWIWLKTYLISIHFQPQTAGGIVSYGFAFGILAGRVAASRILIRVRARNVVLGSSVLIAVTTFAMLHTFSQAGVTIAVFCAGLAMAPVFPTALAMVGDSLPHGSATAMGVAITCGWLGLAVSSPLVGRLASESTLQQALLLLPGSAAAMVLVTLVLGRKLRRVEQR
jgi:fucose permease